MSHYRWPTCCGSRSAILAIFVAAVAWARRAFADLLAARAAPWRCRCFCSHPSPRCSAGRTWAPGGCDSSSTCWATNCWPREALGLRAGVLGWRWSRRAAGRRAGDRPEPAGPRRSPGAARTEPSGAAGLSALAALRGLVAAPVAGDHTDHHVRRSGGGRRLRRGLALAVPAIAAALPLGYYYLLSHGDPAWQLACQYEVIPRLSPLVLLLGSARWRWSRCSG